jgi:hypothetical protein
MDGDSFWQCIIIGALSIFFGLSLLTVLVRLAIAPAIRELTGKVND